ncbi:hypothetical protein [Curtobacterium sp. MCPF17_031]|uniref:hypothetical protein n=1 Tax=Curtobacterium sp. MCPF17_031 TaxID=2175653 RepID=UPI0021ABFFB8|nr:hypothetical protein [Curtobacterium sp. MCPF17_031]
MRIVKAAWLAVSALIGSAVALATIALIATGAAAVAGQQVQVPGLVMAVPGAEAESVSATIDRTGAPLWLVAIALSFAVAEFQRASRKKRRSWRTSSGEAR